MPRTYLLHQFLFFSFARFQVFRVRFQDVSSDPKQILEHNFVNFSLKAFLIDAILRTCFCCFTSSNMNHIWVFFQVFWTFQQWHWGSYSAGWWWNGTSWAWCLELSCTSPPPSPLTCWRCCILAPSVTTLPWLGSPSRTTGEGTMRNSSIFTFLHFSFFFFLILLINTP